MFMLIFPCQVVDLQDIYAFARSNSLLLSILGTTVRKCCYARLCGVLSSNLGQCKIDWFEVRFSVTTSCGLKIMSEYTLLSG
jgi:hypothetical protein